MLMMLMILMISSWIMGPYMSLLDTDVEFPMWQFCRCCRFWRCLTLILGRRMEPLRRSGKRCEKGWPVIFSELRRNAVDLWDPSSLFGCIVVVKHPDLFAQTSQSSQGYWSMFMLDHSCMSKLQCIIGAKVNLLHWSTWCTRTFPQDLSEIFKAFETLSLRCSEIPWISTGFLQYSPRVG